MTGAILDGKLVSDKIKAEIKNANTKRIIAGKRPPGLAVILIGNDPASSIYVSHKRRACAEVGFNSQVYDFPLDIQEEKITSLIEELNRAAHIDGILVQIPLPTAINSKLILEAIDPKKDVDGFHPYNIGRLVQRFPLLRPCTPYGIIQLLKYYQISLVGKNAVIVGASNIVGRPMALELLLAGATVTICHRLTSPEDLKSHVIRGEILIVATGTKDVIPIDWLHSKHILVDVGIHRLADGSIRGDIDFEKAKPHVSWISPVPGGVGPMTIVSLLQNTLYAAANQSHSD